MTARVSRKLDRHAVAEEMEHAGERYLVIGFDAPRYASLFALSPAELEVVQPFIEGQSMRAIAEARGVSVRTVANQISRSYQKLGVRGRGELLELVLQDVQRAGTEAWGAKGDNGREL